MSITAIIPAVVEPDIDATITSLLAQDPSPARIIVAVNNTADPTTRLAAESVGDPRVQVVELGQISGRKAGALNAVLPLVDTEHVLVVDADTVMGPDFLATAVPFLDAHPDFGAVGGVFHGVQPTGFLQWCQYLEYERFAHEIDRKHRVLVLTGTGSLLRMDALRDVYKARQGGRLPGSGYYDPAAITEDNEMSLALKTCCWRLASPQECRTTTELMGTWADLRKQRTRWYRGALDNLRTYGWTNVTRRYWRQQAMLALSVITFGSYLLLTGLMVTMGWLGFDSRWSFIGLLFCVERAATVWHTGWKGRVLAALLLPELVYSAALQVEFVRGIVQHLRRQTPDWHQAAGVRVATPR